MPVTTTKEGIQTITREVDIPDTTLKQQEKVVLPAEIQRERDLRRYIAKNGMFRKGLRDMWRLLDDKGRPYYTKTAEEAAAFVTDICEKAGRSVETDHMTGRLKAVPGWNLDIRVPGMASSEQSAPQKPEGEERQKINETALVHLQDENAQLRADVAALKAAMQPAPTQPVKPLGEMNHAELDAYAAENNITFGDEQTTKADKVAVIENVMEERNALASDPA